MWKNWKLQQRKPIVTLIEILLPALFALILVGIRTKVQADYNTGINYTEFQVQTWILTMFGWFSI